MYVENRNHDGVIGTDTEVVARAQVGVEIMEEIAKNRGEKGGVEVAVVVTVMTALKIIALGVIEMRKKIMVVLGNEIEIETLIANLEDAVKEMTEEEVLADLLKIKVLKIEVEMQKISLTLNLIKLLNIGSR
jgi:hypothetical protein